MAAPVRSRGPEVRERKVGQRNCCSRLYCVLAQRAVLTFWTCGAACAWEADGSLGAHDATLGLLGAAVALLGDEEDEVPPSTCRRLSA